MRARLPTLEECRRMKKWDKKDYYEVFVEFGPQPPWFFGCQDFCHDELGRVNYWMPNPPGYEPTGSTPEPRSKQLYNLYNLDRARWDNEQAGWSKMVDLGIRNDYWRNYHLWN